MILSREFWLRNGDNRNVNALYWPIQNLTMLQIVDEYQSTSSCSVNIHLHVSDQVVHSLLIKYFFPKDYMPKCA